MDDEPARLEDRIGDGPRGGSAPRPTAVVQLGPPGRTPGVLAAVVAIFLAVAIVKPWPAATSQPVQPVAPSATPTPAPIRDPLAVVHRECQDPPGWRTYTKERWSGGTLRVWMTVEPAAGHHAPIEDDLPIVPYATEVLLLGFCTPYDTADRPSDGAALHVWRVRDVDTPAPRAELLAPASAVRDLFLPYGDLLDPPSGAAWTPARYVFQVVGPGNGYERWWAVELDPPLRPVASATPAPNDQPVP